MANKLSVIITALKKKPYDVLDQRKADFDQDFADFKRQISELHVCYFIASTNRSYRTLQHYLV